MWKVTRMIMQQIICLPADGVMAVHLFQQFIRAALHRQVQVFAQVGLGRNGVDQLVAGILRVAGLYSVFRKLHATSDHPYLPARSLLYPYSLRHMPDMHP